MKKALLFAISVVIFASCSNEATDEQLTFFGASIGMEKSQALDSLFAHCLTDYTDSTDTAYLWGLEDRYSYYYSEAVNYGNITMPTRFYFTNDTLSGLLAFIQYTKYDIEYLDIDINRVYKAIADSAQLLAPYKMQGADDGGYYSKVTYKGEPLVRLDTIVQIEENIYTDDDTTIYIVIGIGCPPIGDVPIIEPTDAQLTIGNGSKIKLGGDEEEVKRLLWKEKGASLFGNEMIMMYEDDFVEGMRWKFTSYTFSDDKLWLASLDGFPRTKAQAIEQMHSIAEASRFQKKYKFIQSVKDGEDIYVSSVQAFNEGYTQMDADYELAGGRYLPLVTLSVKKSPYGSSYQVEIDYQYK